MPFELLSSYGIKTAPFFLSKNEKTALLHAQRVGYPVSLKIISDKIIHKTEVGAVKIGIESPGELIYAYRLMKRRFPRESKKGILVQKMIRGIELIVGGRRDPQFGHVVIFGLGGIYTEYLRDISIRVCPITEKEAKTMIHQIRSYPILAGARTGRPVNRRAIVDVLLKTSSLLQEKDLREIDLNPVIANRDGAFVVDAKIIR
ncbi:MAG: acetate--CoA ligase family protein [Candidatus Anstonellales archaeon]